jgi:hypothetical protein
VAHAADHEVGPWIRRHARACLPPAAAAAPLTLALPASGRAQGLLATLRGMGEDELASWAAAHKEQLSLGFMGCVADQAAAAEGADRRRLWELGSRLMALREGLTPVGMERLQRELTCAATAARDQAEPRGAAPGGGGGGGHGAALAAVVQHTAALGLSAEGMALFQQQAAALEAVVGVSRARSLTEVLGRKRVGSPAEARGVLAADAAGRILEVLLSIPARGDRAAMLPDAFTPPHDSSDSDGGGGGSGAEEEEELHTTPLQLLQAVDLWLARAQGEGAGGEAAAARLLPGGALDGGALRALQELREDVMAFWQATAADTF